MKDNVHGQYKTQHAQYQPHRLSQFGAIDGEFMSERCEMAIFASLKSHISGVGQRPPTKFGTVVEAPGLHFRLKARRDRANHFGAVENEYMSKRRKMAIFASLNPHISGGGQPTPTKFGTVVEPPSFIFAPKQALIKDISLAQYTANICPNGVKWRFSQV